MSALLNVPWLRCRFGQGPSRRLSHLYLRLNAWHDLSSACEHAYKYSIDTVCGLKKQTQRKAEVTGLRGYWKCSRPREQREKDHVKLTADTQASGITSSPRNTTERERERARENYVSHKAPHVAPLTVAQVTAHWQHLDGPNENKVSVRSQCLAAGCGNTQESSRPAK